MKLIEKLKLTKQLKRIQTLKETIDSTMSIADSMIRESQFWHAAAELVDIKAKVSDYTKKAKANRDDTFIDLKTEAPKDQYGSDAAKDRYAKAQKEYRVARDSYDEAETLLEWVKDKLQNYKDAIYIIRDIRDDHKDVRNLTPSTEN